MSYGHRKPFAPATEAELAWRGLTPAQQRLLLKLAVHGGTAYNGNVYVQGQHWRIAGHLVARGLVLVRDGLAELTDAGRAAVAVGIE